MADKLAERVVKIETADGVCDGVLVSPQGAGPLPAVIWYPDAFAVRPAMLEMAGRLAAECYAVLVVNQFYRIRPSPVFPGGFDFNDQAQRTELMPMIGSLDHDKVTSDAKAFVGFLDGEPEVSKSAGIGVVGFCMGGSMAVRTAATAPDRVRAVVSFHGGRLVVDAPNSPHRLVAGTKAAFHIGVAAADDAKEPHAKVEMKKALEAAGRPHTLEVYPGTKHGWTVTDLAIYDKPQAERAYSAMVATFARALT